MFYIYIDKASGDAMGDSLSFENECEARAEFDDLCERKHANTYNGERDYVEEHLHRRGVCRDQIDGLTDVVTLWRDDEQLAEAWTWCDDVRGGSGLAGSVGSLLDEFRKQNEEEE